MSSGYNSWLPKLKYALSRPATEGIFNGLLAIPSKVTSAAIKNIQSMSTYLPKLVIKNVTSGNLADSINNKLVIEAAISSYSLMDKSCFYIHLFKAMEKFYGQSFDQDIQISGSTTNIPDMIYLKKSYLEQRYNIQLYQLYQLLLTGEDKGIPCYDILCKFSENDPENEYSKAIDVFIDHYTPQSFEVNGDELISLVSEFLNSITYTIVQLLEFLRTEQNLRNKHSISPKELQVIEEAITYYRVETDMILYLMNTTKRISKKGISNLFGLTSSGDKDVPLAELLQDELNEVVIEPGQKITDSGLKLAHKYLVELYTPYSKNTISKTESSANSWVSWATKSTLVRSIFRAANTIAGLDLSKYSTFEAFVASYGKHLRDVGGDRAKTVFVPIGSLLNYHPPDLDSHFSGPAAMMPRKLKAEYFKKRRNELYSGMIAHANSELKHFKLPLTYKMVQRALNNNVSFYIDHPTKTNEVVLYLTDSFFQSVAPTMGSASQKPVESMSVYLKKPVAKESFITFSSVDKATMKSYQYAMIDQADFHLVLDGQNRFQIIKQVLSELVESGFQINGKKINQIYVETLSYIQIPNKLCDTAFKIRNRSLKCDWFDNFPQSNVKGTLNLDQSRHTHIKRSEIRTCGIVNDNTRPFDETTDEVADTFNKCVHREINVPDEDEDDNN